MLEAWAGHLLAPVFEEGQVAVLGGGNACVGGEGAYIVTGPSPRTTLYSMPSSTTARR